MNANYGSQLLKLDAQNRLSVPQVYRDYFADRGKFILTCDYILPALRLLSIDNFEKSAQKIQSLPKTHMAFLQMRSRFIGNARVVEFDAQQRLALPALLKNIIKIEKSCVLVGQIHHFEIWSEKLWSEHNFKQVDIASIPPEMVKEIDLD